VGLNAYTECERQNTNEVVSYLLDEPVAPRTILDSERGEIAYLGVCAGCHSYTGRLIGPPIQTIQALYLDDPEGLAKYLAEPVKKREDYPEMPPQAYLGEETLLAVSKYVLALEK